MSEPIRYRPALDDGSREPWMKESEMGGYVEYADYAILKAETEELKLETQAFRRTVNEASFHYDNLLAENAELKANVERLKMAGELPFHRGNQLLVELNKLLTAHRHYCDVNAIDYRQMEKDALS